MTESASDPPAEQRLPQPQQPPPPAAVLARRVARVLDEAIEIPFLGRRIGIDGLVGLIPVAGDAIGAGLSTIVLLIAAREGVPLPVLLRMALNVVLELVIGAVPVLGDLFDFVWKANTRNADLLERALLDPNRTSRSSTGLLVTLVAGIVAVGAGVGYGVYALIAALVTALTG